MIVRDISSTRRAGNVGSITVEATISLVTFFITIISILSIICICRVQYRIGRVLREAALDVSRYSYFYYAVGGYSSVHSVKRAADGSSSHRGVLDLGDTDIELLTELTKVLFSEDDESHEDAGRGGLYTEEDSVDVIIQLLSECTDKLSSSLIAGPIAKSVFHVKLGMSNSDTDRYLKSNGVVNGWKGLDFGLSELFSSESPRDVKLCVRYKIRIPLLGGISLSVTQNAITRAWLGGDRTVAGNSFGSSDDNELEDKGLNSIWRMSAFDRGLLFKEIFSNQYPPSNSISDMRGVIGYNPAENRYYNCVSINTFSESYNRNGFQAATACEHTVRKLRITISEVQGRLSDDEQAVISYTVIIPEDANDTVSREIEHYLIRRIDEFNAQNTSLDIYFKIVRAGGNAEPYT